MMSNALRKNASLLKIGLFAFLVVDLGFYILTFFPIFYQTYETLMLLHYIFILIAYAIIAIGLITLSRSLNMEKFPTAATMFILYIAWSLLLLILRPLIYSNHINSFQFFFFSQLGFSLVNNGILMIGWVSVGKLLNNSVVRVKHGKFSIRGGTLLAIYCFTTFFTSAFSNYANWLFLEGNVSFSAIRLGLTILGILVILFRLVQFLGVLLLVLQLSPKNLADNLMEDSGPQIESLVSEKLCANCNQPLFDGMSFCSNCGKKL
ncbi:MAG: hypothetical protein ACTSYI_11535 [Promethearchaeota archaeon]